MLFMLFFLHLSVKKLFDQEDTNIRSVKSPKTQYLDLGKQIATVYYPETF